MLDSDTARPTATDDDVISISSPSPSSSTPTAGPGERVVPVVQVTSQLVRQYKNGTVWTPEYPHYHGCQDSFTIQADKRQVLVNDYDGDGSDRPEKDVAAARGAVSVLDRNPGDYYRNNQLRMPAALPNVTLLPMGNVHAFHVTLSVQRGLVEVNETELRPGVQASFGYDYEWRRSDGQVLDVHEVLDVRYLGDWVEPFRIAGAPMCI